MNETLLFDIKAYAINDGPGIRVSIFFKGCLLACKWCHNPESYSHKKQLLYSAGKCIGAKDCLELCPMKALELSPSGIQIDFDKCSLCGRCADACPTKALEMSGKAYSPEALMREIMKEKVHMEHSGGGVTFTGGEPLMHSNFLLKMLRLCEKEDIHKAVDTSGYAPTDVILEVARYTDLFLYDIKHIHPGIHKQWTGKDNRIILNNLRALSKAKANINIRIPLIGGVNSDLKSLTNIASFLQQLPGKKPDINLLPYHTIARSKHDKLGSMMIEKNMHEPTAEEINLATQIFSSHGFQVETGG